jgi:pimeloyl-ACP methyl ester carboxylesterase
MSHRSKKKLRHSTSFSCDDSWFPNYREFEFKAHALDAEDKTKFITSIMDTLAPVQKATISADGSEVIYVEIPPTKPTSLCSGLVILNGSLEIVSSMMHLALYLSNATNIPIYLLSRLRGATYGSTPTSIEAEIDDLAAVLRQTGARSVMGVSGGALVVLYAALTLSSSSASSKVVDNSLIQKIILFEPTIVLDDRVAFENGLKRFERELDAGLDDGLKPLVLSLSVESDIFGR